MAVWMLGQPTRGRAIERAVAQLFGVAAGGLAAIALTVSTREAPALLLPALAAWTAVCCGTSSLLRDQRAHAAALGGLMATMAAVLTDGTPTAVALFGLARMLDTGIAISASLLLVTAWNPSSCATAAIEKADALVREALLRTAATIAMPAQHDTPAPDRAFAASLAELEAAAEDGMAGSLFLRRRLKPLRELLSALLDLIALAPALHHRAATLRNERNEDLQQLEASLYDLAETLEAGRGMPLAVVRTATRQLRGADPLCDACLEDLERTLAAIATSHRAMTASLQDTPSATPLAPPLGPASVNVRQAALRAMAVCALVAAGWIAWGEHTAQLILLGASLFVAAAGACDRQTSLAQWPLAGIAAASALGWLIGIAPKLPEAWQPIAWLVPITFAAAAIQADRRTACAGLSFNMLFAALVQCPRILAGGAGTETWILMGFAATYCAYLYLTPITRGHRRLLQQRAMRAEIAAIARHIDAPQRAARHLARLRFLILGMTRERDAAAIDGAIASLTLGQAVMRAGALLRRSPGAAEATCLRDALHVMGKPQATACEIIDTLQRYAGESRTHAAHGASAPARHFQDTAAHLSFYAARALAAGRDRTGRPMGVAPVPPSNPVTSQERA